MSVLQERWKGRLVPAENGLCEHYDSEDGYEEDSVHSLLADIEAELVKDNLASFLLARVEKLAVELSARQIDAQRTEHDLTAKVADLNSRLLHSDQIIIDMETAIHRLSEALAVADTIPCTGVS